MTARELLVHLRLGDPACSAERLDQGIDLASGSATGLGLPHH